MTADTRNNGEKTVKRIPPLNTSSRPAYDGPSCLARCGPIGADVTDRIAKSVAYGRNGSLTETHKDRRMGERQPNGGPLPPALGELRITPEPGQVRVARNSGRGVTSCARLTNESIC
jgi:hypothetical protein